VWIYVELFLYESNHPITWSYFLLVDYRWSYLNIRAWRYRLIRCLLRCYLNIPPMGSSGSQHVRGVWISSYITIYPLGKLLSTGWHIWSLQRIAHILVYLRSFPTCSRSTWRSSSRCWGSHANNSLFLTWNETALALWLTDAVKILQKIKGLFYNRSKQTYLDCSILGRYGNETHKNSGPTKISRFGKSCSKYFLLPIGMRQLRTCCSAFRSQ